MQWSAKHFIINSDWGVTLLHFNVVTTSLQNDFHIGHLQSKKGSRAMLMVKIMLGAVEFELLPFWSP